MPRSDLLALLGRHQPADATEAAMLASTIEFAGSQEHCLSPDHPPGHITASAWVLDFAHEYALLTHHRKLGRWFQLGGHLDSGETVREAALREAREESGLQQISLISPAIYDVDVHLIPARGSVAAHYHYDVRFCFEADRIGTILRPSAESREVAWVWLTEIEALNNSESILRLVRKTPRQPARSGERCG